ncbi:hypothetical protein IJ22_17080 [Paenibacillus naphthalenovorans]|uniref:Uncharacterized protein n=1 Tax=Paenibacillus naphthalenovorans TaxID=162209 RepID=A0A0U2KYR3_9BACL|nr:hypothetical protein IJ22_17080 [Paenibacillus naphthalenovorans]
MKNCIYKTIKTLLLRIYELENENKGLVNSVRELQNQIQVYRNNK